ncbi:cupin domain-containing protein [Changchengzhania lutea]|uniref:cupin domain-containing protein n=1 Tax=Changchengzhania lutea TaxID=2049305 RepID=UPI00115E7211|nr:cupin domain-containing protein [Changchengzhania lutea]
MKSNIVTKVLNEIDSVKTNHNIGEKKILIINAQCESNLMQAAIGKLDSGEMIDLHKHETMEEFYFFKKGEAILTIEKKEIFCTSDTFVKVPVNAIHSLKAIKDVQFIYWGVAI